MDWDAVSLVVFDVDGTLYDQRRLRLKMAYELLLHTLCHCSLREARVLSAWRKLREQLADDEIDNVDQVLLARTARHCRLAPATVAALAQEWLEQRPLPHIPACRYDGLPELFQRLRVRGKRIAILSDYPAHAKLEAAGLAADLILCASDVGILKPHPRGLQRLMAMAGVTPSATLMIGDRPQRDGAAARRSGAQALIKSQRPLPHWQTFATYRDPLFTVQL